MAEWIISFGTAGIALSLLPTIFSTHKPSLWTSGIQVALVLSFAVSFWTLGLPGIAAANALVAALWGVIFLQTLQKRTSGEKASSGPTEKD